MSEVQRNGTLRVDDVLPRGAIDVLTVRMKGAKLGLRVTLPVQEAGKDLIFIPEKNKEFFDKEYECVYHDPFEALGGDEFMADMLSWLGERLPF